MNLQSVRQGIGKVVAAQIPCLVDTAKAEALDGLGEHEAAIVLAERHL